MFAFCPTHKSVLLLFFVVRLLFLLFGIWKAEFKQMREKERQVGGERERERAENDSRTERKRKQ